MKTLFLLLALIVASTYGARLGFRGGVSSPQVAEPVFRVAWFKTCSSEMFDGPTGAWDSQNTLPAFPVEMVIDINTLPAIDQSQPYSTVTFNSSLPGVSDFQLTFSGEVVGEPGVFLAPLSDLLLLGPGDALDADVLPTASFVLGQFNGLQFESALFQDSGDFYQVKVNGFYWEILNLSTIPTSAVATGYFQTCCQQPGPYNSDASACVFCNRDCDDTCDMPVCP